MTKRWEPEQIDDETVTMMPYLNGDWVKATDYDALAAENARLREQLDALLNHCPDMECSQCGRIICEHKDPMHFHHDGCPSCYGDELDAALKGEGT